MAIKAILRREKYGCLFICFVIHCNCQQSSSSLDERTGNNRKKCWLDIGIKRNSRSSWKQLESRMEASFFCFIFKFLQSVPNQIVYLFVENQYFYQFSHFLPTWWKFSYTLELITRHESVRLCLLKLLSLRKSFLCSSFYQWNWNQRV